jgi:hypothetical protein
LGGILGVGRNLQAVTSEGAGEDVLSGHRNSINFLIDCNMYILLGHRAEFIEGHGKVSGHHDYVELGLKSSEDDFFVRCRVRRIRESVSA